MVVRNAEWVTPGEVGGMELTGCQLPGLRCPPAPCSALSFPCFDNNLYRGRGTRRSPAILLTFSS